MFTVFKTIRAKLTFWYTFVLFTTLAAFGLIAYTYYSRQLTENLDRYLTNEVRWVRDFFEPKVNGTKLRKRPLPKGNDTLATTSSDRVNANAESTDVGDKVWSQIYKYELLNPKKTLIEVTNRRWGSIVFRSYSVGEESLAIGEYPLGEIKMQTIRSNQEMDLRVASTATNNLEVYVAHPISELKEALDNLFSIFLILIPAALVVSVAGGWLLAYKSLRPVSDVTRIAQKISAHNLDQRIPQRGIDDEIGRLISTFNEMIARLGYSFEQISQFSIAASHELRTPLTIMRGEVELALRNPKTPEEYRRVLASNLEEIVRLSTIIDNLMTLSKAEFGQNEVLHEEEINLKALVNDLYEDTQLIAEKKHISIRLTRNADISIMGDRVRLRQLFLNLIDNAIKYTPQNGKVTISSERINGFAKVEVRDSGIGISKEDQKKIFDRFYRADKGRSREQGGTGLGLSISKWIAELHKGRIEVKSEPQNGSAFSVYLPI